MTAPMNPGEQAPENAQQSLCGLPDAPELLRVRIQPAQFARALNVSKQSVSRWVRDGWITLGADGRLDPAVAIGQLLRRCDPGRLRARWLRQAVGEVQDLRDNLANAEDRATTAEAALRDALASVAGRDEWIASAERAAAIWKTLLVDAADELRAAPTADWPAILTRLELDADDAADAQPETVAVLGIGLADLEIDPALAAELAALDAQLATDAGRGK
ncbi:MAG: hypothetical protein K0M58_04580 [Thiobacillus sp.]|nr:hypothetical protein [Thiobacillus sp.]